jgi:hypothetical protein
MMRRTSSEESVGGAAAVACDANTVVGTTWLSSRARRSGLRGVGSAWPVERANSVHSPNTCCAQGPARQAPQRVHVMRQLWISGRAAQRGA